MPQELKSILEDKVIKRDADAIWEALSISDSLASKTKYMNIISTTNWHL